MKKFKAWIIVGFLVTVILLFRVEGISNYTAGLLELLLDHTAARDKIYVGVGTRIRAVQIDMDRRQVYELMKPYHPTVTIASQKNMEIWYYPDSKLASEPSRCIFDVNSGKILSVVSGDNYHIKK